MTGRRGGITPRGRVPIFVGGDSERAALVGRVRVR
jgi:hypothetical protein